MQRAAAARDATLRIDLGDGSSLVNPPEENVEAWELRGPGYVLLVGTPGDGPPAVWDENSEIRLIHPGVDPLPAQVVQMIKTWPTLPKLTGTFQLRPTIRGREAIELHAPDSPTTESQGDHSFCASGQPVVSWRILHEVHELARGGHDDRHDDERHPRL